MKYPLILICSLSIGLFGFSQTPQKGKTTVIAKFKPPKLRTSWGSVSDSGSISVKEALDLITKPLTVTDDKKAVYTISSYQFVWKRKVVTENEETGKVSPTSSMHADLFRSTPLPEIWITSISQQLKAGEEFHILDVVVKDSQGRLIFAPVFKLKIR